MEWWKYLILSIFGIGIVEGMRHLETEALLALFLGSSFVAATWLITRSSIGEAIADRIRNSSKNPSINDAIAEHIRGKTLAQLDKMDKPDLISQPDKLFSKGDKKKIESDFPEGIIAIMFTDMENFTGLIERGDEEAYRLLKKHNQLIHESAKQWKGHVVKGYGDGFMVAFPSARRAVYAAISIQQLLENQNCNLMADEQIHVRIGIDAGEPIKEGDDYIGRAVNRAARISALASGKQIYVSDTVRQLVGPIQNLQYIDLGDQSLKGFKDQHQIFEISRVEALAHPLDSEIDRGIAELEKRVNTGK
jgi:class 3 adenylate cyclase